jgi:hypothetical protein
MNLTYWRSFLIFEQDLEASSRFIEICTDNYNTYSAQLSHIIMGSSAEFDVVAKLACRILDPTNQGSGINSYQSVFESKIPEIFDVEVSLPRFGISFKPLENWRSKEPPAWWTAHNKVKHHRDTHYQSANLKNALYAVGGLLIVVTKLIHLEEMATAGSTIPVCQVVGRLSGSSEFIELPSSWYFEW